MPHKHIGVLALQGDFELHLKTLEKLECESFEVRTPEDLRRASGLIIPGGESTTVGKLLVSSGLGREITSRFTAGDLSLFGTCMGAIMLARRIEGREQFSLNLMDITVRRNSYGRQVDSFEVDIPIGDIGMNGSPYHAVFIRAPQILETGRDVRILASYAGLPVLARQGRILAGCFHPEITGDTRIHNYFIDMC